MFVNLSREYKGQREIEDINKTRVTELVLPLTRFIPPPAPQRLTIRYLRADGDAIGYI